MTQYEDPDRDGSGNQGRPPDLRAVFLGVAGAVLVALLLFRWTRPHPVEPSPLVPEVRVRKLAAADVQRTIEAWGTVGPKTQVGIVPEVAGKIVFVHSELTPGGVIRANEKVLQIDPRQCELDVQRARAAVDEAQVKLDTELARARWAGQEQRHDYQETERDLPAALAELQVRQARAGLEWAEAELAMAELKLERTSISLPFDVLVTAENADLGRYVTVGENLASVCGIDAFEIVVTVDQEALAWLDVLGRSQVSSDGAIGGRVTPADVRAEFGGRKQAWPGFVSRIAGRIDPVSQAVPLIVEVPKPLDVVGGRPPLLPGASVKVILAGATLSNAVAVPREAIHDGDTVWLVEDDKLRIISLDIAWRDEKFAYVTSGLPAEARIVTSPLEAPAEGMLVQVTADSSLTSD